MSEVPNQRARQKTVYLVLSLLGLGALVVLYLLDPEGNGQGKLPPCVFHTLTGLYCPGCGATRAMHHLLHGQVLVAMRYNPLFVLIALPIATWAYVHAVARLLWPSRVRQMGFDRRWAWPVAGLVMAFTLVRNLPFSYCRYLVPPASKTTPAPAALIRVAGAAR